MISLSLDSESERVTFVPVRDHFDDERWLREVTSKVMEIAPTAHCRPGGIPKDAMDAGWFTVPEILIMEDQIFEDHACIIDRFKKMYA